MWSEYSSIRDNHKQLIVSLREKSGSDIMMNVIFKVFNEGVGFRYSFPEQQKLMHFVLADEQTQFRLTGDHKTFWIPDDYDTSRAGKLPGNERRIDCMAQLPKEKLAVSASFSVYDIFLTTAHSTPQPN